LAVPPSSPEKLLDAAVTTIRHCGYAGASVDDICRAAGVSKGAFFHYFPSKDDLAAAAAAHFANCAATLFADAPFMALAAPRERALGYLRFRRAILCGSPGDFTCLLGTIVQEAHETRPDLAAACREHLFAHADFVAGLLATAKAQCAPEADWDPQALALFTQATLQGAFVLAKADRGPDVAARCLDFLIDYVARLLPEKEPIP